MTSTFSPPIPSPAIPSISATGAILLVSCYELGRQPLSLASPRAVLLHAGFDPAVVDTSVEELSDAAIRAAHLVAIAVPMHTALRLGSRVAERVRALNPGAHICFHGLYATLNGNHLLRHYADSVISGETEGPLLELARALERRDDPSGVPGVGTGSRPAAPVLDPAPLVVPVREGMAPPRSYAGLEQDGVIVQSGAVEATRGCNHECRHCPIPPIYGGRFTVVPRDLVIADARAQIAAGARHLTFGDPDFFNGPGHGLRIMRALRDDYPRLTFDVTIKVEHLLQHRKRLPELAELGCVFVVSAVESLSDRVLAKLDKGHSRSEVEEALDLLDAVGVPMRPSLLPFTPWADIDDYLELLGFVAERGLIACVDPIQLAIRLLVPPGSSLLGDPTSQEWLGDLDAENFTYRWAHADPRMDALQAEILATVEAAATENAPDDETFARIWVMAHQASETDAPPVPAPRDVRRPPPRLTESWFC